MKRGNFWGWTALLLLAILPLLVIACSGAEEESAVLTCSETNPHPVAQSIAETYAVDYDTVMAWFCDGNDFDDILVALETSELGGQSVETLLARRVDATWEQIWEEDGIIAVE